MHIRNSSVLLLAALGAAACAPINSAVDRVWPAPPPPEPPAPSSPAEAPPGAGEDSAAWSAALKAPGARIVVSRHTRRLWLLDGDDVVMSAPVAVGRDAIFRYRGQSWDFSTPTGKRAVLGKEEMPLWIPPDWHYFEKAVEQDLEPVHLSPGDRVPLSDSTFIEVRQNGEVGRVNRYGNYWPFTPGTTIKFDGKIFIPPLSSPQRRVPKVLGTHRLMLGDGYLIHGTPEEDSIGEWASHGCIRMLNRDVKRLYGLVPKGTAVFIY